jgi:hypothetical protein
LRGSSSPVITIFRIWVGFATPPGPQSGAMRGCTMDSALRTIVRVTENPMTARPSTTW